MDGRDDPPPAFWADVPVAIERVVVRRWDGTEWPVEFDRALWVEMEGEQKRGYIVGNAHTHRGRFHACFPELGYVATLSAYQLTAVSAEARYWLRGFLTGTEPSIHEYLGRVDTEDYHEPTAEEWTRYDAFIEDYLRRGSTRLRNRPERALVVTDEERAEIRLDPLRPWTYVGERVLVPDGAGWVEADPQPEMEGDFIAGSVCAERGHCELMGLDSGWLVCRDCGDVQETL